MKIRIIKKKIKKADISCFWQKKLLKNVSILRKIVKSNFRRYDKELFKKEIKADHKFHGIK
jgi:hypothetical protein